MKASTTLHSFNSGELSPLMRGRSDLRNYATACRRSRNFIPTPQGPMRRRSGTRFVAEVKNSEQRTWLVKFIFSSDQVYVLEFGNLYIRVYANHGVVQSTPGVPLEIVSPYSYLDLTNPDGTFSLRMVQSGDVIFIFHSLYAPRKLTRTGSSSFTLGLMTIEDGPFNDIDPDNGITIWSDAQSGGANLTASAPVFIPDVLNPNLLVGTLILLEQKEVDTIKIWEPGKQILLDDLRRADGKTYKAVSTLTCNIVSVNGNVLSADVPHNMLVGDAWVGAGAIPGPLVAGTTYYVESTPNRYAFTLAATRSGPVIAIAGAAGGTFTGRQLTGSIRPTHSTHWKIAPRAVKRDGDPGVEWQYEDAGYGWGTITNITDSTHALIGVLSRLPAGVVGAGNATTRWALQSWNVRNRYPDQATLYKERLVVMRGREGWASVVGDYESFAERDSGGLITAEMAVKFDTVSDRADPVRWISPMNNALLVGTGGDELAVTESLTTEPFGPGNVNVRKQSNYGSRGVPPVPVGEGVLFVQTSGRKIRDLRVAESVEERWIANDMTVLAEHVTQSGVTDLTYQQEPDSTLWAARADGALIGFTLNREQEVKGWHPHRIGGYVDVARNEFAVVESIVSVPAPGSNRDELWMIVRRLINGSTHRYIEYMEDLHEEGDDVQNGFFVDCGLTLDNKFNAVLHAPGAGTVDAENVLFRADGNVFTSIDVGKLIHFRYKKVDSAGKITWHTAAAEITAYEDISRVRAKILQPWPIRGTFRAMDGEVKQITFTTGFGYDAVPAVNIAGGGGTGATATAHMQCLGVRTLAAGAGYLGGDIVTLVGGTFTRPAKLRALVVGGVTAWEVVDGGEYTILPGVAGLFGAQRVTNNIALSGGAGAGATVAAHWGIEKIAITNGGSRYISPPGVSFSIVADIPAIATAHLAGESLPKEGRIAYLDFTTGFGYNAIPTLSFAGTGFGAAGRVSLQLMGAGLFLAGAGYNPNEIYTVQGGTYTRPALIRVLSAAGGATAWEVLDGGDYSVLPGTPAIVGGIRATTGVGVNQLGTGIGAQIVAYWGVSNMVITDPGANYDASPVVTVTGLNSIPATATAFVTGLGGVPLDGVPEPMAANSWRKTVTHVSGLIHLEGQTVDICADGAAAVQQVVVGGGISLETPASKVHIGLPCPAVLQPMAILPPPVDGSSHAKTKRISRVGIYFHETIGAKFGRDEDSQLDEVLGQSSEDLMDDGPQPFTGEKVVAWPDGYDGEALITIVQDQPLPCTVVSITPQVNSEVDR